MKKQSSVPDKKKEAPEETKATGYLVIHGAVLLDHTMRHKGETVGLDELPADQAGKLIAAGYLKAV